MSAVNPIKPTASLTRDQRGYEPSMEEILASIRRIIADDQSLPARPNPLDPLSSQADPIPMPPRHDAADVAVLPSGDEAMPAPQAASTGAVDKAPSRLGREIAARSDAPSFTAHGTIAPQFATPNGPVPLDVPSSKQPASRDEAAYEPAGADFIPASPSAHHEGRLRDALRPRDHFHDEAEASASERHRDVREPHAVAAYGALAPEPSADRRVDYDEPLGRHEPIPFEATPLISPETDQALTSAFNALAATRLADNTDDLLAMTREMIRPLLKTWLDDNLPSMVERIVRAEIERVARGGR